MLAIKELILQSISIHIFFIVFEIIIILRILFLIHKRQDLVSFGKIYERWVLFYRAVLSGLIFSGLVIMSVEKFDVRWQVWIMVVLAVLLLFFSTKESLLYRQTSYKNSKANDIFFQSSKKQYIVALSLILVTTAISIIK